MVLVVRLILLASVGLDEQHLPVVFPCPRLPHDGPNERPVLHLLGRVRSALAWSVVSLNFNTKSLAHGSYYSTNGPRADGDVPLRGPHRGRLFAMPL